MAEPTWREIADRLAGRLENHDFCDNGHASIDEGLQDGCPNCDDRDAMREYRKKTRVQPRPSAGRHLPVHEVGSDNADL